MKTIMHNGVPCVKAMVHRLPSETGVISECIKPYTEERSWSMGELMPYDDGHTDYWQTKHLYITTDEEIKEGDWFINTGSGGHPTPKVYQANPENSKAIKEFGPYPEIRKIIATTDKIIVGYTEQSHPTQDNSKPIFLSQIPQSFIEEYCKAGGIDEVLVELESIQEIHVDGVIKQGVKLNPDNCIIIHPVEEKMYSRDELRQAILDYGYTVTGEGDIERNLDKWIKENL